jgi:hypothetical protein
LTLALIKKDERKEMKRKLNKLKPEYDGNQHPRNHEESQQLNQYYLETAPDEINTNYTYQKGSSEEVHPK